ncbi:MAG: T9SS type A sorting domain-containing protein [Calditrichaceae bacterium]
MTRIDQLFIMLNESRGRNWLKWGDQILYFLGSYEHASFEQDSTLLKQWFPERITWLDEQFEAASTPVLDEILYNHPTQFVLEQNYPNPFNPKTVIRYALPVTSHFELSIYNILGQRVATLVNKKQPAGRYQVEWDASTVSSGVYYYRLEAKGYSEVKKMAVIK